MKYVLAASVMALGLSHAAFADLYVDDAMSYSIDVAGTELPVTLGSLDYPYRAAERGLAGECQLALTLGADGKATDYSVQSCTHNAFASEAAEFAKSLAYDRAAASEAQELTISWSILAD